MTKRLFIYLLLLAFGSFGNPTRSNVGATHIAYGEQEEPQTYTASDYVQDGLVAMWDGEWNVGLGIHNESSSIWKELVNGYDAILTTNGAFGDTYLQCNGVGCAALIPTFPTPEEIVTVQYVFSDTLKNGVMAMFGLYRYAFDQYGINNFGCSWNSPCYVNVGKSSEIKFMTVIYDVEANSIKRAYNGTLAISVGTSSNTPKPNQRYGSFGGRAGMDTEAVAREFKLHACRIYNKMLSEEEIAFNYAIDVERFNLP